MNCTSRPDNTFGPSAFPPCRDISDFTLLFEQSVLQLAPAVVLLVLAPLRALQLRSHRSEVSRSGLKFMKQLAILCLAIVQLGLLVLWSLTPAHRTKVSVVAAAISFVASGALLFLSSVEHARTTRPSDLINVYMLLSLIFDIPQTRSLWLRLNSSRSRPAVALAALFTAGVGAKAVILVLEARRKRTFDHRNTHDQGLESLVSLYDRTVLWWLNPLFWQGFRSCLALQDLYRLDEDLRSSNVDRIFDKEWKKAQKLRKHSSFWAICSTFKMNFLCMLFPRLCLSALKLSQPLLISRVTSLLSGGEAGQNPSSDKGLIGAAALVYLGIAIATASYRRQVHRLITQTRGALINALYKKILSLPSSKLADNAVLTLVSADIGRISDSLKQIDEVLATPIEIAVAIYFLQRQVGISCVAPVALAVVISTMSFFSSKNAVPMQKHWLAAVSDRIAYTSTVLNHPKAIKMLGLSNFFASSIQALRIEELTRYAHFRRFRAWRNAFGTIPQAFAPAAMLLMFTLTHKNNELTPTRTFTSLSLLALLTSPIEELIYVVPMVQSAFASLNRIDDFLTIDVKGMGLSTPIPAADTHNRVNGAGANQEDLELSTVSVRAPTRSIISATCASVDFDGVEVLRDISICLRAGTLSVLLGPVGSGKSTLLKAMIGEIEISKGSIEVPTDDFAYCAQEVWLPNDTIRNLVLGMSDYDPAWYSAVVAACAIDADLMTLPAKDRTMVGTKGVSLSGGQRQRLTLARAIYARKRILIADDVLSGLDVRTSRHVFMHVFGKHGICKRHNMTVVLATHAQQYAAQADSVVLLDEHGFATQSSSEMFANVVGTAEADRIDEVTEPPRPSATGASLNLSASMPPPTPGLNASRRQRRLGSSPVYIYYMRSVGGIFASALLATSLGFALGMKFPDVWIRWWTESEVRGQSTSPLALWLGICFLLGAIAIVSIFAHIWIMLIHTVTRSSAQLHKRILKVCMHATYSFLVDTDSGVMLNRFSNDMSLIEEELATAVMQVFNGTAIAVAATILIITGASYAAAAIPLMLFTLYCIQQFYLRTSRQLRLMELEAHAPLITQFTETISGISTIRAFGWQTNSHLRCRELLDNAQRPYYLLLCAQRWLNLVLQLITGSVAVLIVALAICVSNTSSPGAIGASMLNIVGFSWILNHLVNAWTTLETSLGAVSRCRDFEKDTPQEDDTDTKSMPPPTWPHAGEIDFADLTASYSVGRVDVLKNINLTIKAGERVGICGRSGSGKSSLLLAIFQMLETSTGKITVDDVDLAKVPRQSIRERLVALPQETIVFPGSLRANLDPYEKCSDSQIQTALQKVGLLETVVQHGGLGVDLISLNLSQGQFQTLAMARALLRKSKVLVLDEYSSSADPHTEEIMSRLVQEEFQGSTIIAVAHRLPTIINFDRVIVMDAGKIIEVGEPGKLLTGQHGSIFKDMWEHGLYQS